MRYWFTGDTHFGHANVINYTNRPFRDEGGQPDVRAMDEALIKRWNTIVAPSDCIYHLGDFALATEERIEHILARLHGQKFLILGNHDKTIRASRSLQSRFGWVRDLAEIKIDDPTARGGKQSITLCHYAMRVWNKSHYGAWQLYGHSHGSLPDDPRARGLDVGTDTNDYTPISYEAVRDRMARKGWQPVDHHRGEYAE
jgi:calcineurin-like phosphoesterase family protein